MLAPKKLALAAAILTTIAIGIPAASYAHSVVTTVPVASAVQALAATTDASVLDAGGGDVPDAKATTKLTLTALDSGVKLVAQFNPKEISVDKSVPWTKSKTSTGDQPELKFRTAEGRSMAFELFFDTFEAKTDVHATYVAKLLALASITDPNGAEEKKRPPRIKVQWGVGALQLEGVIASLSCKYTMFLPNGMPVRATCVVQMKEASRATFKRP